MVKRKFKNRRNQLNPKKIKCTNCAKLFFGSDHYFKCKECDDYLICDICNDSKKYINHLCYVEEQSYIGGFMLRSASGRGSNLSDSDDT
jgi:hypothetical protein